MSGIPAHVHSSPPVLHLRSHSASVRRPALWLTEREPALVLRSTRRITSALARVAGHRPRMPRSKEADMHSYDLILTLTGGLGAALGLGYVTQRLGLSPIVGY